MTSSQHEAGAAGEIAPSPTELELSAADIDHTPDASAQQATAAKTAAASETRASIQPTEPAESPKSSSTMPPPASPPAALPPRSAALHTKICTLESQLSTLRADLSVTHAQLNAKLHPQPESESALSNATRNPDSTPEFTLDCTPDLDAATIAAASSIVQRHIKLLHEYNEIKDAGLGLMGLIADARGVRLGGVMEEFGVGGKD